MNLFNEAARMLFAILALIMTTMLTQPMSFNVNPLNSPATLKTKVDRLPTFNNFSIGTQNAKNELKDNSVTREDESQLDAVNEARKVSRQNLKIAGLRPQYRPRSH